MRYSIYDVFTDRPLAGNPLAVVVALDPSDRAALEDATMQALAAEFNLSETAFLLPPERPGCVARARYFTPSRELPTAGHPTVGATFALEHLGRLPATGDVQLDLAVGATPLRLERGSDGAIHAVHMNQGRPERLGAELSRDRTAAALGLAPDDVVGPAELWSCGNPFAIVPLADLGALARVAPRADAFAELLPEGFRAALPFVWNPEPADPSAARADLRCRMFTSDLGSGIAEDPATGSAHGPLLGYLAAHPPDGIDDRELRSLQGVEMGRPSLLRLRFAADGEAWVGGRAVRIAEGRLLL